MLPNPNTTKKKNKKCCGEVCPKLNFMQQCSTGLSNGHNILMLQCVAGCSNEMLAPFQQGFIV